MYDAFCRSNKSDHMSDLLRCCQTLDGYCRDERRLFSSVLVKRVSMPVSVVPGATTFTRIPVPATSSGSGLCQSSTACLLAT